MSGTDAYEFIRICLSHRTEAARRDALKPLLETGIDWELVQREASRHRVLPVFFQVLESLMGEALPSSVREQGREHHQSLRIQNTFVVQELERIVRRFEDAEIPVLTLKGPVLSQTAYGDIFLRRSVDTDVFVPKEQFSEVDRLLKEIAYNYADKRKAITGWRRKFSLYLDGQWQFARGNSFALDVHTCLMPPGYSFPADFRSFWERSRSVRLGEDVVVRGLSPEDQVLFLSHHGIKNQWRALKYVTDIAEAIRANPSLDWENLLERAQRIRASRVLQLGLSLAEDVLEADLPPQVQKWTCSDPIDNVSFVLQKNLQECNHKNPLPYTKRLQFHLATKDTISEQIRYSMYSAARYVWATFLEP